MTVTIEKSKAQGRVAAPPSKSVGHRALICGAFSRGSTIKNLGFCDDTEATLECLKKMGADIQINNGDVKIGSLNPLCPTEQELFCNQSASTLRFLVPIAMLNDADTVFCGSDRLMQRPMEIYRHIAEKDNITFIQTQNSLTVGGILKSGTYQIRGDISSQFITGLMFALSCLEEDSIIEITGDFESASYVEITRDAMQNFGVEIEKCGNKTFKIKGKSQYKPLEYSVEGDYSNAAFLDAFNLLGCDVAVEGLNPESVQGDRIYKQIFYDLKNGKRSFDLSDCPDLAPVLFSVAAVIGKVEFTGTKRLAIKESNRAECMKTELEKFGVQVDINPNSVVVHGGELKHPDSILFGHDDHRIVMALSLLCTVTGGKISGAEAVGKSFPEFFDVLELLKVSVIKNES